MTVSKPPFVLAALLGVWTFTHGSRGDQAPPPFQGMQSRRRTSCCGTCGPLRGKIAKAATPHGWRGW
jgi:hypothetical protein